MSTIALLAAMTIAAKPRLEVRAAPREFRAVWVATVGNIDWPSKPGIPTDQARREMLAILDRCKELGLNAVVWQIRPSADALYPSEIEPWSEYLTGKQGRAPDPMWDPLEYGVREAHKRGLEFHCWLNPYRAKAAVQKGPQAFNHISQTKPWLVKTYGDYLWMDPGEKDVQKQTMSVVLDVVRRYDIDGIHIDDYFYPYKSYAKGTDFPDDRSYNAYRSAGGKLARGDWRRANVDTFVQDLNDSIHKAKPWMKFGISPFGIYRPGYPRTVKAGMDQYAELYADPLKWFQKGWCDYLSPQLYWKMNSDQAYRDLLEWWADQNSAKRHLWPGNFTGRTAADEGNWPASEIIEQVKATREHNGATGNIHFSMKALMRNTNGVADALKKAYSEAALVPASPWLSSSAVPKRPNIRPTGDNAGGSMSFFWSPGGNGDTLRWICVYYQSGGKWSSQIVSAESSTFSVPGKPSAVVVTVVDRVGNESEPTAWPVGQQVVIIR